MCNDKLAAGPEQFEAGKKDDKNDKGEEKKANDALELDRFLNGNMIEQKVCERERCLKKKNQGE